MRRKKRKRRRRGEEGREEEEERLQDRPVLFSRPQPSKDKPRKSNPGAPGVCVLG